MLFLRALILLAGGALLGVAANAIRPEGLRVGSFESPTVCDESEAAGVSVEMEPSEVSKLCGSTGVVIADARSPKSFAEGHVADAVHLPCDAAGSVASQAISHLEEAKTVIVYGHDTDEARPVAASLRRRLHGVRIAVLRGGFPAWSAQGLACVSGPCDDCAIGGHK